MIIEDFEYANPDAASLMQSLRAFGYDISTAVADLIDNSITAKASRINIQFEWNNGNPWISIADNGYGMSEEELFIAMKAGSKNPLAARSEDDLGRFGLGLKTASFSQCKRLTVASKKVDDAVYVRCWDLDLVSEQNEWILLKTSSNDAANVFSDYFRTNNCGTVVIWEKIDRIIPEEYIDNEQYQEAFLNYAQAVKSHIAMVFSAYMHGHRKIEFSLNGRAIELWDPFMSDNPLTTNLPTETVYVKGHEVLIKPYILPHQNKLTSEEYSKYAGQNGWNAQQGFYIYRNKRLIVAGDWLIPGMEKLDPYRLARISIDIGNETDSEWNIDVRKSTAVPPVSIQNEIKRIAVAAQRESAKVYRHRGKKIARKAKKERAYVWHQNLRNGKIGYAINRDHPIVKQMLDSAMGKQVRALLDLIEETVPVPMIISDYSEKPDEMLDPYEGKKKDSFDGMIEEMYKLFREVGYSPEEAVQNIAGTEPFIYSPDKVALFCEKEGINYE